MGRAASVLWMVSSLWLVLLGLGTVVAGLVVLRLHAFLAMMLAALVVALATPSAVLDSFAGGQVTLGKMTEAAAAKFSATQAPDRVMAAFGETCGQMGLLIAMASIIGRCLLDSGGALRIVKSLLGLMGQARVHLAFVVTGFTLAIPVYFDAVFYLLMPIGKAMARTTGKDYLLYVLTIVAGATMAHSLVPPTPGPAFAAKELGVPMGMMMVGGSIVGLFTAGFGLLYALWANRRFKIELPPEDAVALGEAGVFEGGANERGEAALLPPLGLALLPIVIPLVLICYGSIAPPVWFTNSGVALSFGAIASLVMLMRFRQPGMEKPSEAVQAAIMSGATILVITAAGGALGSVLRQTDIARVIQTLGGGAAQSWALPMVFAITALVRTAQGSATVAMITAAPIAKAFAESGDLGFHPLYLALAVGCGSKPVPWLNDSGFWIITRMTGMKESETLKLVTPMMSLMGLVGLPIVMLGAWLYPMR